MFSDTVKSILQAAVALLLLAAVPACRTPAPAAPICAGCNVLLISMDTLRADHLGAYGYERPTSPNIDALANSGVVFARATSQSAWTRPAHASMLTGLYPSEHGIVAMSKHGRLSPDVPTLARILSEAGYDTVAFTGGANMSAHFGFDSGFGQYSSPGRRFEELRKPFADWLDGRKAKDGRPWFAMLHAFDPHRPYRSEPEDRKALGLPKARPKQLRAGCTDGSDPRSVAPLVAEYDAAIRRGDRGIAGILSVLEERGLRDDTLIVFTSDHGEEFLEHGRCFHIRALYREVVDVPLIVAGPGIEPARVEDVVPASVAVTPTVLDAVGVRSAARDAMSGPSLAPFLAGTRTEVGLVVSETSSRYVEGRGHGHVRALTEPGEKLVHWIAQDRYEYFDLDKDPREKSPIADGERVRAMAVRLERWLERHPLRVGGPLAVDIPPKLERELRRLGYLE